MFIYGCRILALGAGFAIKMLRKYAILQLTNERALHRMDICSQPLLLSSKEHNEFPDSRRLHEMAYYLEIIRNIQCQLAAKFTRLGKGSVWFLFVVRFLPHYACQ